MKTYFFISWLVMAIIILGFLICAVNAAFYPVKFESEIQAYSAKYDLNPALVASIINVESGYNSDRISQKGAVGLMQLMPSTAEWISEKLHEDFEQESLLDPDVNIKFGSFYLSYLFSYFNDFDCAVCAFNAGMGNVRSWINNKDYFQDGKFKNIPFNETKNYLNKVKKNLSYYKKKY